MSWPTKLPFPSIFLWTIYKKNGRETPWCLWRSPIPHLMNASIGMGLRRLHCHFASLLLWAWCVEHYCCLSSLSLSFPNNVFVLQTWTSFFTCSFLLDIASFLKKIPLEEGLLISSICSYLVQVSWPVSYLLEGWYLVCQSLLPKSSFLVTHWLLWW